MDMHETDYYPKTNKRNMLAVTDSFLFLSVSFPPPFSFFFCVIFPFCILLFFFPFSVSLSFIWILFSSESFIRLILQVSFCPEITIDTISCLIKQYGKPPFRKEVNVCQIGAAKAATSVREVENGRRVVQLTSAWGRQAGDRNR